MASARIKLFTITLIALVISIVNGYNDGNGAQPCVHPVCNLTNKYRSFDGTCNNLNNTLLGSVKTIYQRILPARYSENSDQPRKSVSGSELPGARVLSSYIYDEANITDPIWKALTVAIGQFIAHDLASTPIRLASDCCHSNGQLRDDNSQCFPILVSNSDKAFKGKECLSFFRSQRSSNPCDSTDDNSIEQFNSVTHFLDLSLVYGNSVDECDEIRQFEDGRLLTEFNYDGQEFPPSTDTNCIRDATNDVCFKTGDRRANQNFGLTTLQIIFVLFHNYLAEGLLYENPDWTDEKLFNEARRLNIAMYQHVVYKEYLFSLIGTKAASEILEKQYDPHVNPSVINEFTAGAFRFGHSQILGRLDFYNEKQLSAFKSVRLSDWLLKPGLLRKDKNFEQFVRGMTRQQMERTDSAFDIEATRFLFKFENELGTDISALDIQRGRDHGLGTYNDAREYCKMERAKTFEDFTEIDRNHIRKLKNIYNSPDDVDLIVGGGLERPTFGTLFGPTFNCIFLKQFSNMAVGDRYFYTTKDPYIRFNRKQLKEIQEKSSLAGLLCRTTNIQRVQKYPLLSYYLFLFLGNPLLDCSQVKEIDFSYWKEN